MNFTLKTEYKSKNLRAYFKGDTLVAVAISQDGFDNFVNYFCVSGLWDQDSTTSWVSTNQLQSMIEDNQN